jgi:diguanylate cyclase (GGDEF)-like protein
MRALMWEDSSVEVCSTISPVRGVDMEGPLRILMLEDVASDAELQIRTLWLAGVRCEYCRVETEADFSGQLETFNPHLVVSDFTLPTFDGLSALKLAQQARPDVLFIFVSGTIGEERAIEALKQGATDYVLKNNLARLPAAVSRAVRESEHRERSHRESAKRARLECVRMIQSRISSAALRIRETNELLREACLIAFQQGRFPLAVAVQIHYQPLRAELVASSGHDESHSEHVAQILDRVQDSNLIGRAVREKQPVAIQDIASAQDFPLKQAALASGYRSVIALPLITNDLVVAIFMIYAAEPEFFDVAEAKLLADLAGDVSFALDYIAKEKRLNALAHYDVLTGLANRQLLHEHLKQALALAHRLKRMVALLFLDLDHFKAVNDNLGHAAGDRLLNEIGARLASCTREGDIVARFGGDEFVMVLQNLSSNDTVGPIIQRVIDIVSQPVVLEGRSVRITCSIGVALYPRDGVDHETLLRKADTTMYRVKQRGRGEFLFHAD